MFGTLKRLFGGRHNTPVTTQQTQPQVQTQTLVPNIWNDAVTASSQQQNLWNGSVAEFSPKPEDKPVITIGPEEEIHYNRKNKKTDTHPHHNAVAHKKRPEVPKDPMFKVDSEGTDVVVDDVELQRRQKDAKKDQEPKPVPASTDTTESAPAQSAPPAVLLSRPVTKQHTETPVSEADIVISQRNPNTPNGPLVLQANITPPFATGLSTHLDTSLTGLNLPNAPRIPVILQPRTLDPINPYGPSTTYTETNGVGVTGISRGGTSAKEIPAGTDQRIEQLRQWRIHHPFDPAPRF